MNDLMNGAAGVQRRGGCSSEEHKPDSQSSNRRTSLWTEATSKLAYLSEALEMEDQDVREGPQAHLHHSLLKLLTVGTLPGIIWSKLKSRREDQRLKVHTKHRGKKKKREEAYWVGLLYCVVSLGRNQTVALVCFKVHWTARCVICCDITADAQIRTFLVQPLLWNVCFLRSDKQARINWNGIYLKWELRMLPAHQVVSSYKTALWHLLQSLYLHR